MQLNIQSIQTFSQTGSFTADLVWSLREAYVSVRNLFGKAVAFTVVLLGIVFLQIILWVLMRQLKKEYRTDFDVTPDNYKALKIIQTSLQSKIALLIRLKAINTQNIPFLLRGIIGQIQELSTILESYHNALESQLSKLDKLDTGDKGFKVVTEAALWSMRTPHYEYRF